MNKNKVIFAIIGAILLALVLFGILSLNSTNKGTGKNKTPSDFTIWMIGDNIEGSRNLVNNFKKFKSEYSNKNIKIESFPSYEDYTLALTSAITSDKTPDIFILNNNEKQSVFLNQIRGIDPLFLNPNDFRKKYKGVFADDLIITTGEGKEKQEFLKGVPVGYESLGIFYNRRYIKASELTSLSALNNVVATLKDKKPNLIPIGIGNGTTVYDSADIVTQFFMLEEGVTGLKDVNGNKLKQSITSYFLFGDINGYNGFNSRFSELTKFGKTSLDLFSKGETFMVVGYPSLINKIAEKGFSKNFLQAAPFPHYFSGEGKTLVNYNYFVINKNTENDDLANAFLLYLSSDIGAQDYLNEFTYYLPALLSLESDKLDEKISDKYNVVLGDFFNSNYELSSFDKGIKNLYDRNIITILDNASNYLNVFSRFASQISCETNKIITLEDLSKNCE